MRILGLIALTLLAMAPSCLASGESNGRNVRALCAQRVVEAATVHVPPLREEIFLPDPATDHLPKLFTRSEIQDEFMRLSDAERSYQDLPTPDEAAQYIYSLNDVPQAARKFLYTAAMQAYVFANHEICCGRMGDGILYLQRLRTTFDHFEYILNPQVTVDIPAPLRRALQETLIHFAVERLIADARASTEEWDRNVAWPLQSLLTSMDRSLPDYQQVLPTHFEELLLPHLRLGSSAKEDLLTAVHFAVGDRRNLQVIRQVGLMFWVAAHRDRGTLRTSFITSSMATSATRLFLERLSLEDWSGQMGAWCDDISENRETHWSINSD